MKPDGTLAGDNGLMGVDAVAEVGAGGWARFPQVLLGALRAEAPEGAVLKVALWNGETVTLRRIVSETAEGLLGEMSPPATAADAEGTLVAIPWQAVARIAAAPPGRRRARPGFRPEQA